MTSEARIQKAHGVSFVERQGSGPCLVFLHGIGSNAGSFQDVFAQLPETYHLLAWNAPGYGCSDPLQAPWPTADEYAAVLADFLHAQGIGPAIVIGHSLGALIAASFARARPERVSHLILASCAAGHGVPVGAEMPAAVTGRIRELDALGAKEFARTRAPRLVHAPQENPEVVARVEHAMSRVSPAGYAQAVRMLANGALNDTLRDVPVPCSFITGTHDQVTPPEQTHSAAKAWATARGVNPKVVQIEHAGHAVYLQRPDAFAAELQRLVAAKEQIGEPND